MVEKIRNIIISMAIFQITSMKSVFHTVKALFIFNVKGVFFSQKTKYRFIRYICFTVKLYGSVKKKRSDF